MYQAISVGYTSQNTIPGSLNFCKNPYLLQLFEHANIKTNRKRYVVTRTQFRFRFSYEEENKKGTVVTALCRLATYIFLSF